MTAAVRLQARAEATRRRIIDVSIDLFKESGFSGTNLSQIIRRANVTPGAFYYHFPSKNAVAFSIIDEVAERVAALRSAYVGAAGSGLESVISMTFELSALLGQDRSYWVAAYLEHTMARHTAQGMADVSRRIEAFIAAMAESIPVSDLRAGVTPQVAARTMFTAVYGCLAMTDLVADDIATRFAECWRVMLPGLVATDALAHFEDVLSRTASHYQQSDVAAVNAR